MSDHDMREEQHFWSTVALLIYAVVFALCVWVDTSYGDFDWATLGMFDLAVVGLASFRLVHLLTFDKIFDMVRTAFMDQEGGRLTNAERGWRRLVCEFMQCIWCTGMWAGLAIVTIYFLGTWGRLVALVFAAAGLGSLLQVSSKALARA
jgi:Protein of unknown function (DUF1360)